jgi:hypothetical protein
MADVVDFPARNVEPDSLPEAGDRYQAYGLWHRFESPMLVLIFSTWMMKALRYDGLERHNFKPLGKDRDGDCIIRLDFSGMSVSVEAVIAGRKLYRLYADLAEHRVHWLWEPPEGRAAVGEGEPVIRSITMRNAIPSRDTVAQGNAETSGFNAGFVPSV